MHLIGQSTRRVDSMILSTQLLIVVHGPVQHYVIQVVNDLRQVGIDHVFEVRVLRKSISLSIKPFLENSRLQNKMLYSQDY
jgi:lipoate synthase